MGKLGYTTLTLTDLTNALPATLTLQSSLGSNVQTKNGNNYTPDFTTISGGVIITPSLFLGQDQITLSDGYVNPSGRTNGFIYYRIGNAIYKYNGLTGDIYVDSNGRLHYCKNLTENITIEARIENLRIEAHDYSSPLVVSVNPITILLLEEGSEDYNVVISTDGGRIHFDDLNSGPITMTASLMKGATAITEVSYSWSRLGGTLENNTAASLQVARASVVNREYYTCEITYGGNTYSGSQFLYDFTDVYSCEIEYNKMPLLTDDSSSIIFAAKLWNNGEVVNNGDRVFKYEWAATTIDGTTTTLVASSTTAKSYTLNMDSAPAALQEQDFVLRCRVYRDDNVQIATGMVNVQHSVQYSVRVSPQTIFIPTAADGTYVGNEGNAYTFEFSLVDTAGVDLPKASGDGVVSSTFNFDYGIQLVFEQTEAMTGKYHYKGTVNLGTNLDFWNNNGEDDLLCEFSYTYKGQIFYEQIVLVKSRAGATGPAFSGYVVDLSNNFHTFTGAGNIVDPNQTASAIVNAYYGAEEMEISEISIQGITTPIYGTGAQSATVAGGLIVSAALQDGKVNITIRTGSNAAALTSATDTIFFVIKVSANGHEMNVVQGFTYLISETASYYINTSHSTIVYSSAEGKYIPPIEAGVSVSALQKENGIVSPFSSGAIFYSYDENLWTRLALVSGSGIISDYANKQTLYIRLYGSQATATGSGITTATLDGYSNYLYDRETIPIITSVEGYDIGGENILRGTKYMRLEEGGWSSDTFIDDTEDFAISLFSDTTVQLLASSLVDFDPSYCKGKLCLNFEAKNSSWHNQSSGDVFNCNLQLFKIDSNDDTPEEITTITFASLADPLSNREKYSTLPTNTWVNFYKVFSLEGRETELSQATAFKLTIVNKQTEATGVNLQVRKIKLDKSNVPSSWMPNAEDDNIITESIARALEGVDTSIAQLSQKAVSLGSGDNTYTFSVIKNVNGSIVSEQDDNSNYTPITITDANGNTYQFLTIDKFKEYIDYLNGENARNFASYSSTLITESMSEINNSIIIRTATSGNPEGSIMIRTSTYDTAIGRQYQEALRLTSNKISFQMNEEELAWMTGNKLFIPNAQIVDNIYFGKDTETNSTESHLRVMTTSNGVGFIWEGQ